MASWAHYDTGKAEYFHERNRAFRPPVFPSGDGRYTVRGVPCLRAHLPICVDISTVLAGGVWHVAHSELYRPDFCTQANAVGDIAARGHDVMQKESRRTNKRKQRKSRLPKGWQNGPRKVRYIRGYVGGQRRKTVTPKTVTRCSPRAWQLYMYCTRTLDKRRSSSCVRRKYDAQRITYLRPSTAIRRTQHGHVRNIE